MARLIICAKVPRGIRNTRIDLRSFSRGETRTDNAHIICTMAKNAPTILSAAAVAGMCGFIFCMSAHPGGESGALSRQIVELIISIIVPDYANLPIDDQASWFNAVHLFVRKLAHFTEFAILGGLVINLLMRIPTFANKQDACITPTASIGISWILTCAYAASDELHQAFVPGRACMFSDVLIDSAGALTGILFVAAIAHIRTRIACRQSS